MQMERTIHQINEFSKEKVKKHMKEDTRLNRMHRMHEQIRKKEFRSNPQKY